MSWDTDSKLSVEGLSAPSLASAHQQKMYSRQFGAKMTTNSPFVTPIF